jgi:hypothetical protein
MERFSTSLIWKPDALMLEEEPRALICQAISFTRVAFHCFADPLQ